MGNTAQGYQDAVGLKALKLIKEKAPIAINLQCADALSFPAAGTQESFVEIRLIGIATLPN
jgi:hypothetical protein